MNSWRIAALVLAVLFALDFLSIFIAPTTSLLRILSLLIISPYMACVILLIISALKRAKTFGTLFIGIVSVFIYGIVILLIVPLLVSSFVNAGPNPIAVYAHETGPNGQTVPQLTGGIAYLITPTLPLPFGPNLGGIGGFRAYFLYLATSTSSLYLSQTPVFVPEWAHLLIVVVVSILLLILFQSLLKRLFGKRMGIELEKNDILYSSVIMGALVFLGFGLYPGLLVYVLLLLAEKRFAVKK